MGQNLYFINILWVLFGKFEIEMRVKPGILMLLGGDFHIISVATLPVVYLYGLSRLTSAIMSSLDGISVKYPNYRNNELPMAIGCPFDTTIDDARNYFLRYCYKDVVINDIVPLKRNCQQSCAWRVVYKLKDRTPDYVEPGETVEDFFIPLPEGDGELNKLFANITAVNFGMRVATKAYTYDKTYAVVVYVPISCPCPAQDFSETAKLMIPRMRSVAEVSLTFGNMTL